MKIAWRMETLRNGLKDAMAYRLEFILEVLGSAVVPAAIQWVFWYAMFVLGGKSRVGGMSYAQMVHYTLTSLLFTQVRGGDLDFELAEMIRSGQLSNYLVRPVGVVEFVYLRGVAPKIFVASFCLAAGLVIGTWIGIHPARMIGAMALAVMGNVIHYQLSVSLSAMAFLWEEAYSVLMVKNMIVSLLSGELLPLNLFPPGMRWMWKATPFYLYVYGPTQYALGRWSDPYFLGQVGIACLWLAAGWLLIRITWGLGIRRYLSLGG